MAAKEEVGRGLGVGDGDTGPSEGSESRLCQGRAAEVGEALALASWFAIQSCLASHLALRPENDA